jgi:hypothetical protein
MFEIQISYRFGYQNVILDSETNTFELGSYKWIVMLNVDAWNFALNKKNRVKPTRLYSNDNIWRNFNCSWNCWTVVYIHTQIVTYMMLAEFLTSLQKFVNIKDQLTKPE